MRDGLTLETLFDAAARGDLGVVREVLDRHPDWVDQRAVLSGHTGRRTALHFAVGGRHPTVVRLLLERGADPNLRATICSQTPLTDSRWKGKTLRDITPLGYLRITADRKDKRTFDNNPVVMLLKAAGGME